MPFNMSAASAKKLTIDTVLDFGNLGKLNVTYCPNVLSAGKIKEQQALEKESEDPQALQVAYFLSAVTKWDATYASGDVIPLTPEALTAAFASEDLSETMLDNILLALLREAAVGEAKGTRLKKLS